MKRNHKRAKAQAHNPVPQMTEAHWVVVRLMRMILRHEPKLAYKDEYAKTCSWLKQQIGYEGISLAADALRAEEQQ